MDKCRDCSSLRFENHLEPGAARYGNFPDYYRFNPSNERMKWVTNLSKKDFVLRSEDHSYSSMSPISISRKAAASKKRSFDGESKVERVLRVLDVGCNTGELTVSIYSWLVEQFPEYEVQVIGIDLDENLISCARSKYCDVFTSTQVSFQSLNIMADSSSTLGDFDIVCCFSVTLWIHINHGDEGLEKFLTLVSGLADNIIIEPQPWKCYRTAVRRAKRAGQQPFENYEKLKVRTNVVEFIDSFLISCKFKRTKVVGTTDWDRQISLYTVY